MLFQTLDDKKECVGIYVDGKLSFHDPLPDNLTQTWSPSPYLRDRDIQYAQLYCEGKSLDDVCPEYLKEDWESINQKLKAIMAACMEAKVSLKENCFFDLTPKKFLIDYCYLKSEITRDVLKKYPKPKEYDFYKRFTELLQDIKYRDLNIKPENIKPLITNSEGVKMYRKLQTIPKHISFNMFGSKTGRLTTNKSSFPILNFPKVYRRALEPQNDWFVVFDMNAAELRTSLALNGKRQIEGDLHEWSAQSIFNGDLSRQQAKEVATSWLYDSHSSLVKKYDPVLSAFYEKEKLLKTYWVDGVVNTPFNRQIEADKHHAISYLNQSTFIDLFHRQIIKVDDYLKGKKSFIGFMVHDEFVMDLSDNETNLVPEVVKILEDTQFGKFPVNVKIGKNYGSMKKLDLK